MQGALAHAGQPIVSMSAAAMPKRSGALAGGLSLQVKGPVASFMSAAPYGPGAVWGSRGKWSGFERYGGAPRFVVPQLEARINTMAEQIARELHPVFSAYGWFH
jgi:hypothetical protein